MIILPRAQIPKPHAAGKSGEPWVSAVLDLAGFASVHSK